MFKNVASQKIAVFAFDITTGAAKTGDAANITVYVSKDWGSVTVLGDTSATEMDATNAKGWYLFDLTQGETNADALLFTGKSSTANISIVGQIIYTDPPSFTSFVTPTNLTAAQIATGVWQDTTAGDFTTALSVGKSVMNGVSLGTGLTVNDITTKTGFALTASYDFAKGTTAMTESYAANTVAPTPVQAIFAIHQMLQDFSISGTTYTVFKLDHVTTAFLGTLDSATTPTSLVRA